MLDVRTAGYCVLCDRLVERAPDGSCPAGHPPQALSGRIPLAAGEAVPRLPRFNLAAFLIPPIWGPAHGQWVGAVFLPIWLFMDSIISTGLRGGVGAKLAASAVVVATVAFGAFFAKRANGLAYRRVCDRMSVETFVRRQRLWAIAAVPLALALLGWAVWFHVAMEPTLVR